MEEKTWTCDCCGELISCVEDGYLEWFKRLDSQIKTIRGMSLVHRYQKCRYSKNDEQYEYKIDGSIKLAQALWVYLGNTGLQELLDILHKSSPPYDEVLSMILRLHGRSAYEAAKRSIS